MHGGSLYDAKELRPLGPRSDSICNLDGSEVLSILKLERL